jgi:hypothetical protein
MMSGNANIAGLEKLAPNFAQANVRSARATWGQELSRELLKRQKFFKSSEPKPCFILKRCGLPGSLSLAPNIRCESRLPNV